MVLCEVNVFGAYFYEIKIWDSNKIVISYIYIMQRVHNFSKTHFFGENVQRLSI